MKKLLSIFIIIFSLFLVNVSAKEEILSIENIEIEKQSNGVEVVNEPTLNKYNIKSNLLFHDTGEFITYKITIKNNSKTHYLIKGIKDDNKNSAISYKYVPKDMDLDKNKKQTIYMTISYKDEIPSDSTLEDSIYHLQDTIHISIDLVEYSFKNFINPKTGNGFFYFILIIIVFGFAYYFKVSKKIKIFLILLAFISIPNVFAKDFETVNITLNNEMTIPLNFLKSDWNTNIDNNYTKIKVTKTKEIPDSALDVSEKQDGSIKAWIYDDTLFIGSQYRIYAPADSSNLFNKNNIVNKIDFDKNSISSRFSNNLSSMFSGLSNLQELDSSWIDTSNATTVASMFSGCSNIKSLNLDNWNLSKITTPTYTGMGSFIYETTSLKKLSCKGWIIPETFEGTMFRYSGAVYSPIEVLDVTGWDLSKTKDISNLFANPNNNLKEIVGLDTWDTSHVENMYGLFFCCTSLTHLDLSNWDTSQVTNMYGLFFYCTSLTDLDLSNWDTSQVTNMSELFLECSRLSNLSISNWDTSKVTDMSYMFNNCNSLTELDLSNLDTSKVTDMSYMFNCNSLTELDLSSFDLSSVENVYKIFGDMNSLEIIITPKKINEGISIDLPNLFMDSNQTEYEFINNLTNPKEKLTLSKYIATFISGQLFNQKIKKLAGNTSATYSTEDNSITKVVRSNNPPNENNMLDDNIVSVNNKGLIYAWFDNGIIYYYTKYERPFLNSSSSDMFYNMRKLESIDLGSINTSRVTDMSYMFYNCQNVKATLNLYNNPTSYNYAFSYAAISSASGITVNYRSNVTNIDSIIATKSSNSNVVKGNLIS